MNPSSMHFRILRVGSYFFAGLFVVFIQARSFAQPKTSIDSDPRSSSNTILLLVQAPGGEKRSSSAELASPDGTLSLESLIRQVIARNPSFEQAAHALSAASERFDQVTALDDPMFTYMLGPGTLGSNEFDAGQKFEVSQSFPWPGKRRLRGEAAKHEAEEVRGDLESVRQQLVYEARVAYINLWFLDRALEINSRNQALLGEIEGIAQRKYGAGIVPKQDVLQVSVEREMLIHDGTVLTRVRNRAIAKINALLNQDTETTIPSLPQSLSAPVPPRSLPELRAAAEQNRPELRALGARVQSMEAYTALARKDFYPDFSVMAAYDSFWDEKELRPSIGFSVNVPLQRSRRRAAVSEAKANLASAESEARRMHRDILLEVHEAFEEIQESLDGITLYESHLLPVAEENLEAARSGYSSGEIDFLALVSAQKLLMDTTLNATDFSAAYHNGVAKLDRAIGISFSDSTPTLE